MSRSTRSRINLPGDIRDYMMTDNQVNVRDEVVREDIHTEEEANVGENQRTGDATGSQMGSTGVSPGLSGLVSGFPTDPVQFQNFMLQSMLAQQQGNAELQRKNQELMAQLVQNSNRPHEKK